MKNNLIKLLVILIVAGGLMFVLNKKTEDPSMVKVGILQPITHPALTDIRQGIMDELNTNGYIEGKNVEYLLMNAEGSQINMKTMSQKLVAEKVDLLIGIGVTSSQTLASDTKDIPIIASAVSNPVQNGLVLDEKKPGGNVTAISDITPVAKQLDFMLRIKPDIKVLGVLYTNGEINSIEQITLLKQALSNKNITLKEYGVAKAVDLNQVVEKMASEVDAVYIPTDNLMASTIAVTTKITNKHKIPVFPGADTMVKDGGLATISITQYETGKMTGKMGVEILSGKNKPATMPVIFYDDGKKMLNLKTAKELGITIPEDIMQEIKANGVIFE